MAPAREGAATIKVEKAAWCRALRYMADECERGTIVAASVDLPAHGVGRFTIVMLDGADAPLPGVLVGPDENGEPED